MVLQAQSELRRYSKLVPTMENEPDYMKRWRKAKSKIMKGYDEFHALILLSRTSGADYEFLLNKDPLFIARNFISKMIQS